jgi:hypothetical protein
MLSSGDVAGSSNSACHAALPHVLGFLAPADDVLVYQSSRSSAVHMASYITVGGPSDNMPTIITAHGLAYSYWRDGPFRTPAMRACDEHTFRPKTDLKWEICQRNI